MTPYQEFLVSKMTHIEAAQLEQLLLAPEPLWSPHPKNLPQQMAYASTADVIGYGGAAGGGKTETGLGMALTKHQRTLILRRTYKELLAINDRLTTIVGSREGHSGIDKVWRNMPKAPGVTIEYGSVEHTGSADGGPRDEQGFQGRPRDLLMLDEAAQFPYFSMKYLSAWVRSEDPDQRCQVFLPMNPPMSTDGLWVFDFFGPWLDDKHPNPALSGDLRWFVTDPTTGVELEVDGPAAVRFDDAEDPKDRIAYPKSRTFIFSNVDDNPYYAESGYKGTLQAMPEPFRSRLLKGLFKRDMTDHALQVIPSAWIDAAFARWTDKAPKPPMVSAGVDVARGGKDNTVIAKRHEGYWYDKLKCHPGATTPDGPVTAALIAIEVGKDKPPVHVDVIGVGASVHDCLRSANFESHGINVAEKAMGQDRSGQLTFANQRAEMVWRIRDLLDPQYDSGIALHPEQDLKVELCAYRWKMRGRDILLEDTDDIIERIGRSPDRATAVCLAAYETPRKQDLERVRGITQARLNHNPVENYREQASANAQRRLNHNPYARN